jgi:nicotinamidase-related amidase
MHKPDGSDLGMLAEFWEEHVFEGTDGSEIHPSLDVRPDDFVVRKNRYSGFLNTNLDDILTGLKIKDLVITGVMTNLCCETTARDAFCRDYRVFFPADANGTACEEMHVASLINLAYGFATILRSSDIIDSMKRRNSRG